MPDSDVIMSYGMVISSGYLSVYDLDFIASVQEDGGTSSINSIVKIQHIQLITSKKVRLVLICPLTTSSSGGCKTLSIRPEPLRLQGHGADYFPRLMAYLHTVKKKGKPNFFFYQTWKICRQASLSERT